MILLVTLVVILIVYFLLSKDSKYKNLPTVGINLPLIGHAYRLGTKEFKQDPFNEIWRIYKKYQKNGMVFLNTFGTKQVWIGDFNAVKYVFNHQDGNGRGFHNFLKETRKVEDCDLFPGIIVSQKDPWMQQRRFTLKTLRDFGFGKQGMEGLILEEVSKFKSYLDGKIGEPIDIAPMLTLPIVNALWKVTVGERYDYNDPKLLDIGRRMTEVFKAVTHPSMGIIANYPFISKLFLKSHRNLIKTLMNDVIELMEECINEHKETFDPNAPRDFIDVTLKEMENTTDAKSSFYKKTGFDNLKVTLFDLFLAGSETTSTTLTWAALYMVRYPEIQSKVQHELDTVVGHNRLPNMEDKRNLPYVEAVIMEIQRHACIVPLGLRHKIERDLMVNGQRIPAGTEVSPLMAEILKGDTWEEGNLFRPERFLDEEGFVRKPEQFIPFSIGKRICLGESLAKAELFLFFSGLFQQFKFLPEVDGVIPQEQWAFGLTCLPQPFKLKLEHRF